MKNIELSEKQKDNLLEMCNKLFPETYSKSWDIENLFDYEPIDDENFECFHWFEFCMTHLQNQILTKASELGKSDDLEYDFFSILTDSWYQSHPVDFLYEEFKKL